METTQRIERLPVDRILIDAYQRTLNNRRVERIDKEKSTEAIQSACGFPKAAAQVNDMLLKSKGYRKLIVKNYIVFYIPDDEIRKINVMRVMYYAMDYLKEL